MLKSGNGHTQTCVNNLLRLERGEVPLDQLRGVRSDLVDKPATVVEPFYRANVLWLIENYEPRVEAGEVAITGGNTDGNFKATTSTN
jgi:phage baseplate assembly protein W